MGAGELGEETAQSSQPHRPRQGLRLFLERDGPRSYRENRVDRFLEATSDFPGFSDSGTEQTLEMRETQNDQGWACFPSSQRDRITDLIQDISNLNFVCNRV